MRCNLTQITVLFASEYTMKWCKLEGDLGSVEKRWGNFLS